MNKSALITGSGGQDGSYLIEILLSMGYTVHGIIRKSSVFNTERIDHLMTDKSVYNKTLFIHYGDVTDPVSISGLISAIQPDEIYNLAAMSHVKVSFEIPYYTAMADGIGVLNVLEAARTLCPNARVYQASTSELFGGMGFNMPAQGYNENSLMYPRSPYGCAKMYGYCITRNYRESYGMFACSGILHNHESTRRGDTFVTKKITNWFNNLYNSHISNSATLELGNIHAKRDWGHSKDYCMAMHLMLQADTPEDYVIASGETRSVKDFIDVCLRKTGLCRYSRWEGSGLSERLVHTGSGNTLIRINPKYFRPAEVDVLLGDSSKARTNLGWYPSYTFDSLVDEMLGI